MMLNDGAHPYQPRSHRPSAAAFVICSSGETVSFGELESRANQGAHLLRADGVNSGDHIAILMENRREFLEICFAADRAGVYYTTISTHLDFEEIAYILRDCDARILIASERYAGILIRLDSSEKHQCNFYLVNTTETDQIVHSSALHPSALRHWESCVSVLPTTPIADEKQGLDMLYSSGTTGRPKGIKWPLPEQPPGSPSMLIDLLTSLYGYSQTTRYLSPAPLYHAAPLRHSMVVIKTGGTAYIMDRFDPENSLRLIEKYGITHSQWVPTMFVRLLKMPDVLREQYDLKSMQMAVHAAAPCPIDIKQKMIAWWGNIIHEYYSGTENNGFTSIGSDEWLSHPGSVGQSKLGIPHICDESGQEVATGVEGEIYFENGHQFVYHNDPEKTAQCTNAEGWTTLGDIGFLDEDGYLFLTDRKSFLIISGGVNIYPQKTEDALLSHPAILDAAVIGIPDDDLGEAVLAIVQLTSPDIASTALSTDLIAFCKKRLSSIYCPRHIVFRQSLPRTATGKLYKRNLKADYWPESNTTSRKVQPKKTPLSSVPNRD